MVLVPSATPATGREPFRYTKHTNIQQFSINLCNFHLRFEFVQSWDEKMYRKKRKYRKRIFHNSTNSHSLFLWISVLFFPIFSVFFYHSSLRFCFSFSKAYIYDCTIVQCTASSWKWNEKRRDGIGAGQLRIAGFTEGGCCEGGYKINLIWWEILCVCCRAADPSLYEK